MMSFTGSSIRGMHSSRSSVLAILISVCSIVSLAQAGQVATDTRAANHVRATDLRIRAAIADGLEGSALFRDLVAELDASDVVVYVESDQLMPERLQGRMNSVMRFIVWGTIPLGAITGGALASWIGLKETLILGGAGCCLPFLPVLFSPVRSVREMPEPLDEEPLDVILADAEAAAVPPPHI